MKEQRRMIYCTLPRYIRILVKDMNMVPHSMVHSMVLDTSPCSDVMA